MYEQVGHFLEFAAFGEIENVIATIVQVVTGLADGAQGGVARGDAGQGDGFLGLEAGFDVMAHAVLQTDGGEGFAFACVCSQYTHHRKFVNH